LDSNIHGKRREERARLTKNALHALVVGGILVDKGGKFRKGISTKTRIRIKDYFTGDSKWKRKGHNQFSENPWNSSAALGCLSRGIGERYNLWSGVATPKERI